MKRKRNLISSELTDDEYEIFKNIKRENKFNTSETIRFLIKMFNDTISDNNNIKISLDDINYHDLKKIKENNGLLTDSNTINHLINHERALAKELGSWSY